MQNAYITLDFPTVPTPLLSAANHRSLTQRLSDEAGFLHDYIRDGLNLIQPFRTLAHYAGYLTVQHHMLCDLQRLCASADVQRYLPDLTLLDPERARRVEADLVDLNAWPTKQVRLIEPGLTVLETLGWLYAGEGLMLSLDTMASASGVGELLGLTDSCGGQHLFAPIGARTHAWRNMARMLDSKALADPQGTEVVAGACSAYHRLDELLSLALSVHAEL